MDLKALKFLILLLKKYLILAKYHCLQMLSLYLNNEYHTKFTPIKIQLKCKNIPFARFLRPKY